ncbi:hypothetical protein, partial [Ferruginibacter sp.]
GKAFLMNEKAKYSPNPKSLNLSVKYKCITTSPNTLLLGLLQEKMQGVVENYEVGYGQDKTIKLFMKSTDK